VPLLIVGTQIDLRNDPSHLEKLARQKQKPIRSEEAAETAKQVGAVKYVECSALTQKGLKNVFDEVRLVSPRCSFLISWKPVPFGVSVSERGLAVLHVHGGQKAKQGKGWLLSVYRE
jgi:hypothetical protein